MMMLRSGREAAAPLQVLESTLGAGQVNYTMKVLLQQ